MANPNASFYSRIGENLSDCASEAAHLGTLAVESALHGGVQDPIDAGRQLINHISKPLTGYELPPLELFDAPPPAKFGSTDWVAETVGTGLGKAADALLLAYGLAAVGATAAVGEAASSGFESGSLLAGAASNAAKAALIGGTFGALLSPSNDKQNFWAQRGENGLVGIIGGGLAGGLGYVAKDAVDGLLAEAEQFPLYHTLSTQIADSVVRGVTSTVARSSVSAVLGVQPITAQNISEHALQSAVRSGLSEITH
jgi:hypothetical protein